MCNRSWNIKNSPFIFLTKGEKKHHTHCRSSGVFQLMIWNIFIIIQWLFLNNQMLIMVPCYVIRNESAKKNEAFSLGGSWVPFVIFPGFLGKSINRGINDGNRSLAGHHEIISLISEFSLYYVHTQLSMIKVVTFQWFCSLKSNSHIDLEVEKSALFE